MSHSVPDKRNVFCSHNPKNWHGYSGNAKQHRTRRRLCKGCKDAYLRKIHQVVL